MNNILLKDSNHIPMARVGKHTAELTQRVETRWLIPTQPFEIVHRRVAALLRPVHYSRRPWVRTIYLNNDAHDVPWDLNIKLRRYFAAPIQGVFKLPRGNWVLETKVTTHGDAIQKHKSRRIMNLAPILRRFRKLNALHTLAQPHDICPLNRPLRPFLGIEYQRSHFIHTSPEGSIRVTLDRDTRYWHQLEEGTWMPLGSENGIRFEIKCDSSLVGSARYQAVIALLTGLHAVPIISKRYAALNKLSMWQRTLIPLPFYETPGVEYAAIFDVNPALAPTISAQLFSMFARPHHAFSLDPKRKWMSEWSMACVYLGGGRKINLYGDFCREVREQRYIRNRQYQFVVTRKEVKSASHAIIPSYLKACMRADAPCGVLIRYKRQFWLRSRSDRIYKVSVNRFFNCATQRYLTGLQLKYAGSIRDRARVRTHVIAQELRMLAMLVRKTFPLHPSHQSLRSFACEGADGNVYPARALLARWACGRKNQRTLIS